MTREEAIAFLQGRIDLIDKYYPDIKDYREALDMAIKALEQPSEDCVSRQSMLDAITEIDDNTNMDIYTNEVREIIKDLPPVTPTQKWVPVSERLPEKNVEVLATTEWGAVTIAEMYSANDWFIHEGTTNAETDEIVAWMPLPAPYKAEMESEE